MKSDMDRIPKGWAGLDIYGAYVNPSSNEFILLGNPREEDGHNCDAMGCSTLDHVLIRVEIPNWQATQHSVEPTSISPKDAEYLDSMPLNPGEDKQ